MSNNLCSPLVDVLTLLFLCLFPASILCFFYLLYTPMQLGTTVAVINIYKPDSNLLCVLKSVKLLHRKCLRLKSAIEIKLAPYRGPQCTVFVLRVYSPLINSGRVYSQLKVEHCFCIHSSSAR
jgi:hypothetical protein